MKKRLWLLLSLVLCLVALSGCEKKKDDLSMIEEATITEMKNNVDYNIDAWAEEDFSNYYKPDADKDDENNNKFKTWMELQKGLGKLVKKDEAKVSIGEGDKNYDFYVLVSEKVKFENKELTFIGSFSKDGTFVDIEVDEITSVAKTMKKALMNTLMGMGTVFVVLILISFIISLFGIVNKAQNKPKAAPVEEVQQVQAPQAVEEELVDDLELVAVITAAIMASMGDEAPADGLVVRSIKKRNVKNWKNA